MLAGIKARWASRGPFVGGLPIRSRKARKANRAREKDSLRHAERREEEK